MSENAKNDGGPAFPQNLAFNPMGGPGMSLRDYFAGQALSGYAGRAAMTGEMTRQVADSGVFYDIADAMLRARKR